MEEIKTNMFKVGDILRCKKEFEYHYAYTKHNALVEFKQTHDSKHEILVKMYAATHCPSNIGREFWVNPDYFELATEEDLKEFNKLIFKMAW